jgi:hypothetical protein
MRCLGAPFCPPRHEEWRQMASHLKRKQGEGQGLLRPDVQSVPPTRGHRALRGRRVSAAQPPRRGRQGSVHRLLPAHGRGVPGQARRLSSRPLRKAITSSFTATRPGPGPMTTRASTSSGSTRTARSSSTGTYCKCSPRRQPTTTECSEPALLDPNPAGLPLLLDRRTSEASWRRERG